MQTFPVKMATDEELKRFTRNVLRFHAKQEIDPATFEQPARLHRKDPKNLQFQLSLKEMADQQRMKKQQELQVIQERIKFRQIQALPDSMTDKEVDELMAVEGMNDEEKKVWMETKKRQDMYDQKMQQREKDMMKVAPDGEGKNGSALAKQQQKGQRKTKQVKVYNEAKRKLRYEEFYPWVLEDYDAKQAWVGNFEANETDAYCLFILDEAEKCFKMYPIDKFYKFTPRNKYATLTLEEAEAKMAEKSRVSRWLMSKMEKEVEDGTRIDSRYRKAHIRTTMAQHDPLFDDDDESNARDEDDAGMDYEDEFQDDEEAPIMEGPDDEKKLIESRMKKEMLKAANMIEKSDDEDDEFGDLFDSKPKDKESKKLKKALTKNAINEVYASDDDDVNPYLSEEDEDEEEDEANKVKKEQESDSEETQNKVKLEDEEEEALLLKEEPKSPSKKSKKIYISMVNQGFITIKAPSSTLQAFPRGQWNSKTAIKREHAAPAIVAQAPVQVKQEPNAEPNTYVLTYKDIDDLLEDGPLELTQVVHLLKRKVANGQNRTLLKKFLKEDFTVKNKKLYRKNQAPTS